MPLGRIGAPFIYASDEYNTVTVAKTVQELEAENEMHVTGKLLQFSTNSSATQS